jgi:pantetheine-phosphate adenylyltransferase
MAIAMYPGSFDPITNGHLDILERATQIFDKVILTIAVNNQKTSVFSEEERLHLIRECIAATSWSKKVTVDSFTGLLVDHARKHGVHTLVRGVRQLSDFEYEFRMALMNRRLASDIDTIFLMPREELTFVSASLVKEVGYWGGDLSSFVPENVARALEQKFSDLRRRSEQS